MHPAAHSPLRRATCAALLLTQLGACMTWRPVPGTAGQQAAAEPISRARIRLRNGTELSLRDVDVRSDSVTGYSGSPRERRALSAGDVASIDRRQLSVGRTAALALGAAAAITFVAAGLAVRDFGDAINAVPSPRVP
jgi:hypothetical protein